MKSCIALIGFMGCGKSTAGRLVARATGFEFVDTDAAVEKACGLSVRDIFRTKGEPFFREVESRILVECLEAEKRILATGGGVWMNEGNRNRLLEGAWCVWLKVDPDQVWERVRSNLAERPLLAGAEDPRRKIQELLEIREPFYSLAHATIDTNGRSPDEVSSSLLSALKEERPFDLSSLSI